MLYELGLLFTIAVTGWLALDPVLSAGASGRSNALGALALSAGVWAGAELLLHHTSDPERVWVLRRVMYAAVCFLPVAWLWLAAQAASGFGRGQGAGFVALCALPSAFFYSSLYWGPGLFSDWSTTPTTRGPLFWANLAWNWTLIAGGFSLFVRAARHIHRANVAAFVALATALIVPIVGNLLYVMGWLGPPDLTPILLGVGAVLVRVGAIDSGLAAFLPFGRGDLLDQLEAGVLVAGPTGRVVVANPAAHRLLREQRITGRQLDDLIECARNHPDRSIEVRRFPLRTPMGEVGDGVILTDRTEAEHTARRLQLAARLESVGFLTAGIAHEVNNPLAYIRSNLGQLDELVRAVDKAQAETPLSPPLRALAAEAGEVVSETREGVERIARLVERLRSFARNDSVAETVCTLSLVRVAERAAEMARVGFAPDVIRLRADPIPPVEGVESQLVQVVLNLLVNAIQASDEDPRIEVDIRCDGEGVELAVADRGRGIADADLAHLFDPFFTTKPPGRGSGLGLSLSCDLAVQHGGTLTAENRPGGGAIFRLWLPAA